MRVFHSAFAFPWQGGTVGLTVRSDLMLVQCMVT